MPHLAGVQRYQRTKSTTDINHSFDAVFKAQKESISFQRFDSHDVFEHDLTPGVERILAAFAVWLVPSFAAVWLDGEKYNRDLTLVMMVLEI
jgi:hypothetical protein